STSNDPPRVAFAKDLLTTLNAPVNAENLDALVTWMGREQNPSQPANAAFNPLNVQTGTNQVDFPNWQAGVQGTAAIIGQSNMAPILSALQQGASAVNGLHAIQSTPC